MDLTCCNEPRPIHDQPDPEDKDQTVGVVCGHCGHDYGQMTLKDADKLLKQSHAAMQAEDTPPS